MFTYMSGRPTVAASKICNSSMVLAMLVFGQIAYSADTIKIGIIGDQTMSSDLMSSYGVLEQGAKALKAEQIDAVVHVGDLVESTGAVDQIRAAFSVRRGYPDGIGKPWHLAPGDHDVNPPQFQPDSRMIRRCKRLYFELYHSRQSSLTPGLWHSFDIGSYHFVSLNSQESLDVDPRWGDIFLSRISDEELEWLRRDLDLNRRARGVVVFLLPTPLVQLGVNDWAPFMPFCDLTMLRPWLRDIFTTTRMRVK